MLIRLLSNIHNVHEDKKNLSNLVKTILSYFSVEVKNAIVVIFHSYECICYYNRGSVVDSKVLSIHLHKLEQATI